MNDDNFYMLAKTMFGFEEILAEELRELGAQKVTKRNRAVSFKGDKGFMYKANLNLRTALRVLKPIAHFQAHNQQELYKGLSEVKWEKYINIKSTFSTHATIHSETFTHSKYVSLVMKDAIADRFRKKFGIRPNVNPKNADVTINIHIAKHKSTFADAHCARETHTHTHTHCSCVAEKMTRACAKKSAHGARTKRVSTRTIIKQGIFIVEVDDKGILALEGYNQRVLVVKTINK